MSRNEGSVKEFLSNILLTGVEFEKVTEGYRESTFRGSRNRDVSSETGWTKRQKSKMRRSTERLFGYQKYMDVKTFTINRTDFTEGVGERRFRQL